MEKETFAESKEIAESEKKNLHGEDALKMPLFHHDNNYSQKASRCQVLSCYKLFVTTRLKV